MPSSTLLEELQLRVSSNIIVQYTLFKTKDLYQYANEYQCIEIVLKQADKAKRRNRPHTKKTTSTVTRSRDISTSQKGATITPTSNTSTSTTINRTSYQPTATTASTARSTNIFLKPKPHYEDPHKQELSDKERCFECGGPDHITKNYLKKNKIAVVEELDLDFDKDSEKE